MNKEKHIESKLAKKWTVPYTVVDQISTNMYKLKNSKGRELKVAVPKRLLVKFNPNETKNETQEKILKIVSEFNYEVLGKKLEEYDEIVKEKKPEKIISKNDKYADLRNEQWLSSFTIDDFVMHATQFDTDYRYLPTHYLNMIPTFNKETHDNLFNERRLCYTIYNINGNHWIAFEIDFCKKIMNYYDPFQINRTEFLSIKFYKIFKDYYEYNFVEGLKQTDGYNCRVFCANWVVSKMQNRKIDQNFDPDYFRWNMHDELTRFKKNQ